jgi:hypothetical protein
MALHTVFHLPACTTTTFYHSHVSAGGLGILPVAEEQQVYLAVHVYKLLMSPDLSICAIACHQLREVAHAWHTVQVEEAEQSPFFGWHMTGHSVTVSTPTGDASSIWHGAARAYVAMGWSIRELAYPRLLISPNTQFAGPRQHSNVIPALCRSVFERHVEEWAGLCAQGRVAAHGDTIHLATHHWIHSSARLNTKEYQFALKCRLGLLPTHAAPHHHSGPTSCRACGYAQETANHVLGHCPATKAEVIARHNRVCNTLAQAGEASWASVLEDAPIPGTDSPLRPDIYCTRPGRSSIVEVTISYEDAFNSSLETQARQKTAKYADLAATVQRQLQLQVQHAAFVVGFTGVVLPASAADTATSLDLHPKIWNALLKRCVAESIKGSYAAWRRFRCSTP